MKILLIIICVFPFTGYTQNNYIEYLNKSNEAEYCLYTGNFDKATQLYSELEMEKDTLINKDYFYLGILSFLNNDSLKGMKYLKKYVSFYGNPTFFLTNYKEKYHKLNLSNFQNEELLRLQKVKVDELTNNPVRKSIHDSIEHYLELDADNRKTREQIDPLKDFAIQESFLNYLKKYGIPNYAMDGDIYLEILYHVYNPKLLTLYKEFFYSEIMKGNSCPFAYAILVDRNLTQGTVYGSGLIKPETKEEELKVRENRKKIGMSPYFNGTGVFPIVYH